MEWIVSRLVGMFHSGECFWALRIDGGWPLHVGSLPGGFVVSWTHNVALVFGITGALSFLISFCFSFTALGHADRYIPKKEEEVPTTLPKVVEPFTDSKSIQRYDALRLQRYACHPPYS